MYILPIETDITVLILYLLGFEGAYKLFDSGSLWRRHNWRLGRANATLPPNEHILEKGQPLVLGETAVCYAPETSIGVTKWFERPARPGLVWIIRHCQSTTDWFGAYDNWRLWKCPPTPELQKCGGTGRSSRNTWRSLSEQGRYSTCRTSMNQHVETDTIKATFDRRHFIIHFLERKVFYFDSYFIEVPKDSIINEWALIGWNNS